MFSDLFFTWEQISLFTTDVCNLDRSVYFPRCPVLSRLDIGYHILGNLSIKERFPNTRTASEGLIQSEATSIIGTAKTLTMRIILHKNTANQLKSIQTIAFIPVLMLVFYVLFVSSFSVRDTAQHPFPFPVPSPVADGSAVVAAAAAASSGSNVLFPSFRYNNRNYWLEYSTPPTTIFPEYEDGDGFFEDVSTTPKPGPHFLTANHTVKQIPIGSTVVFDCKVGDLLDHQVIDDNLADYNHFL